MQKIVFYPSHPVASCTFCGLPSTMHSCVCSKKVLYPLYKILLIQSDVRHLFTIGYYLFLLNIIVTGTKFLTVIEQVKEFCYLGLGSLLSDDARCHREIKRRIAMEKEAFYRRKDLPRRELKRCLKKRMVKTLIWSVTLYCVETWTLRKEDITRLEVFEMWIWRRMEKISWTEHISNEEVLKLVEEERSMLTTVRTRQRNYMGYIMRGYSLKREIIEECRIKEEGEDQSKNYRT